MEHKENVKPLLTNESELQELVKSSNDNVMAQDVFGLTTVKPEPYEDNPEFIDLVEIDKEEPVFVESVKSETVNKPLLGSCASVEELIKSEEIEIKDEEDVPDSAPSHQYGNSLGRNQCYNRTTPRNYLIKNRPGKTIKSKQAVQKNPEDWSQCDHCDYKTIRKTDLMRHLLTHKDSREVDWFQCNRCDYKARRKDHLKPHMLTHQNSDERRRFQCNHCNYQTVRKAQLTAHLLRHKDPEELTWFLCDHCHYKTVLKRDLKTHLRKHRNPAELKWFRCDYCDYKTIRRGDINRHVLLHKNSEELDWFHCDRCEYKTIQKNDLKSHLRKHKNPEVDWFRCDECDYRSYRKNNFKIHVNRHKNSENRNCRVDAKTK